MMDYWEDSYGDASVLIGVRSNDDKMLVRSPKSTLVLFPRF